MQRGRRTTESTEYTERQIHGKNQQSHFRVFRIFRGSQKQRDSSHRKRTMNPESTSRCQAYSTEGATALEPEKLSTFISSSGLVTPSPLVPTATCR